LGARVRLTPAGGQPQSNAATTSVGYSTSSDRRVHFGLGAATSAESIEILWPSGTRQVLKDVKADQILNVQEYSGGGQPDRPLEHRRLRQETVKTEIGIMP
jgi:hypothetical protein